MVAKRLAGPALLFALVGVALLIVSTFASVAGGQSDCQPRRAPAGGPALAEPVKLTPDRDTEIVNFGPHRGTKERDLLIVADPPLPASVKPAQISIDLSRDFERVGETLPSEMLVDPTFTEPVISPNRREITTTVCLGTDGAKAGSYTGLIRVGGPDGLERAAIATTINVKAQWWIFAIALVVALGVAAFLLVYRRIKAEGEDLDRDFVLESLLPLGVAFGAMYAVYSQNPSWGDDPVTAGLGLIGTALAATGLKSLLDAEADRKS